jgi:hypothetical protein
MKIRLSRNLSVGEIKVKSNRGGGGSNSPSHNRRAASIKVKSNIRGGGLNSVNHNRVLAV